ncbi:MAG: di-trans,poly-cis-decaprenylcistransferase [Clostridiales bacterium 38-18]|nr:MAG: di-trans,poly-cis-decaprenylcistransferase [Clostridiales bacterium 38-18]
MLFNKRPQEIDLNNLPEHIAFIMDGNGRWAKKRGMPRLVGHNAGTETLKRIVKESKKLGIKYITFYAFSTENWKRPTDEVNGLMNILVKYIQSEINEIHSNEIKINILGDINRLPEYARQQVEYALDLTKDNQSMQFNIALNYGSRDEIVMAIKKIAENCVSGALEIDEIDEEMVSSYLYTAGMPDPDLLIRTSGEFRLSNFLLWQVAYTEFKFETIYWPDFNEAALKRSIIEYQNRNRRYGAI